MNQARACSYPGSFEFSRLTYTFFHYHNANGPHLLVIHGGSDASWLTLIIIRSERWLRSCRMEYLGTQEYCLVVSIMRDEMTATLALGVPCGRFCTKTTRWSSLNVSRVQSRSDLREVVML